MAARYKSHCDWRDRTMHRVDLPMSKHLSDPGREVAMLRGWILAEGQGLFDWDVLIPGEVAWLFSDAITAMAFKMRWG